MKMKSSYLTEVVLFLFFISECLRLNSAISKPCALRPSTYGYVCVCNLTYCDYQDPISPIGDDGFVLTSSSNIGLRFFSTQGQFSNKRIRVKDWTENNEPNMTSVKSKDQTVTIKIDRSRKYQKIVGFGGALTGSVSYVLKTLTQQLQDAVYKSYFSKKGISYNTIRIAIGGCDFDLGPWAYNELPKNDKNLSNFTKLDYRDVKKVEQIERLKSVSNKNDIKIMASAWSPPKWMKTVHSWGGFNFLKKEYYQTWADYHLRFIEIMEANNVPIWAITTGNEPLNSIFYEHVIKFISLGWTPDIQAQWVVNNLGPTIRNSKFKDVKIFSNDDQRYTYPFWFKLMNLTSKESLDYLDGLAVHWYWDDIYEARLIDETHKLMPDKLIFNTESSYTDFTPAGRGPNLGSWDRAEKYAHSYFEDLQHYFNGYIDWNLIVNEQGGPTYVKNYVDSPIIANVTSGQEIYKQPIFYAIGHFSKFIPEGSIRIHTELWRANIESAAFERPDGTIVCIFANTAEVEVAVTLDDTIRDKIEITIPPKSLHTIEYK